MISPDLPAELKAALDARLEGLSRGDIAARAALISKTYRDGGNSAAIRSETDALAYALARMPATYAAVAACLNALGEVRPDFSPRTLLDVGAGPGTASFAAEEAFPSLKNFALLDRNGALRGLAGELARDNARLSHMTYAAGEARAMIAQADAADLVVASYVIGELAEGPRDELVALLPGGLEAGSAQVERRTQQALAEVLAEEPERRAGLVVDVVPGGQVERFPGLEREHRPGALLVGVEGDLLLECEPLLLRQGHEFARSAAGTRRADLVAVHHHRELLSDEERREVHGRGHEHSVGRSPERLV